MVRVISVRLLQFERKLNILLILNLHLLPKVVLLVSILEHEIQTVLLCRTMEIKGIEVIAIHLAFKP